MTRGSRLYLDAEHHDGYLRDQDVFGPAASRSRTTWLPVVDYRFGATLTACSTRTARGGVLVIAVGTEGRAGFEVTERGPCSSATTRQGVVLDLSATPEGIAAGGLVTEGERLPAVTGRRRSST